MRKFTLVRGARQLLTLRGPSGPRRGADLRNLGIIQDGAVLIADRVIVEVGPSRRLENLAVARDAEEIDASGCVVLPGFVDSHIHVVRRATQELSPRSLKTLALRVIEEAVRCGTTAHRDEIGSGSRGGGGTEDSARAGGSCRAPADVVSTFLAGGGADGVREAGFGERLLGILRRRKLAEFAEIGCEAEAWHFLKLARELGLGLKVGGGAIAHRGPDRRHLRGRRSRWQLSAMRCYWRNRTPSPRCHPA